MGHRRRLKYDRRGENGDVALPDLRKSNKGAQGLLDLRALREGEPAGGICDGGHFVCAGCAQLREMLLAHGERDANVGRNPVAVLLDLMEEPEVPMHDPVHHILVPAALLIAYRRCSGTMDLPRAMTEAIRRGKRVPGGTCGFWDACGAAVGAGIFMSIVTGSSPYSESTWGMCNMATARCLEAMAVLGGPRCCKRTSLVAVHTAAQHAAEHLGIVMDLPQSVQCSHGSRNSECIRDRCPFHEK